MKYASIAILLLAVCLGCGTPGIPLPPSLELPEPVQDLRASRKGDKVALAWTVPRETTDRTTLRVRHLGPTRICRSLKLGMTQCTDKVGEIETAPLVSASEAAAKAKAAAASKPNSLPAKPVPVVANAGDALPHELETRDPTGFMNYAVEVLNTRGRSAGFSNQVQVPLAPTLPPPDDLAATVTADGIVLNFTAMLPENETPELRHSYRVYREQQGTSTAVMVGEIAFSPSPQAQLLDHSFEWQKTYQYWVTAVTIVLRRGKSSARVEGDNSAPITVFANDVFPPAVPMGLQAVFSGIGQQPSVDLTWAPNSDPDLAGYNVYRREENGAWTRLNPAPVPTPAYRDSNVAAGRTYSYAITALDTHGNESVRSPETSETVPGGP
jgi:hypothetical protein